MKILWGDVDRSQLSVRERREVEYIDSYQRRRLAGVFAEDRRREAAKPAFSFIRFLGFDR